MLLWSEEVACIVNAAAHNGAMNTTQKVLDGLRAAGLTQAEIARKTGIPQPRLSRWEAGAIPASADDALKLLRLAETITKEQK